VVYRTFWAPDRLYDDFALLEQVVGILIVGIGMALWGARDTAPLKLAGAFFGLLFAGAIVERLLF
jgi:hypothetical protein